MQQANIILELKESIISQANCVEKILHHTIDGFLNKDKNVLKRVIEVEERQINKNEVKIDKLYTKIFALYHTEAKDLRTVLMVSKMNIDLERIADHCVNFAESGIFLIDKPLVKPLIDIPRMSELVKKMLSDSINSFINEDDKTAYDVCRRDEDIDLLNEQIIRELLTYMISDPRTIERAFHLIRISHNIEKIADITTNIAEETIFLVTGKNTKHSKYDEKK